jgi:hypothetical protein
MQDESAVRLKVSDAKKTFPEVEVLINGRKRKLIYNLYSFMRLDDETGKNIFDGTAFDSFRPRDIVALLWAGLVNEDPTITIDEVAKTAQLSDLQALPTIIQAGFYNSMPSETEKKSSEAETKVEAESVEEPVG